MRARSSHSTSRAAGCGRAATASPTCETSPTSTTRSWSGRGHGANRYDALTARFIAAMDEDFAAIGLEKPDHEPRATAYIPEIVAMIGKLVAGGYAYVGSSGDVFYAVAKFPKYGQLSGKKLADLRAGARVDVDEAKRDPLDFVLWKQAKPGEPCLGFALGHGPAGLAHRVLRDGGRATRHRVRHPRRRHGPQVPAPRERDRAELRRLRCRVREAVDAQRIRARGRREDVEVARQFLHRPRRAAAPAAGGAARLPARLALPCAGQLHG